MTHLNYGVKLNGHFEINHNRKVYGPQDRPGSWTIKTGYGNQVTFNLEERDTDRLILC